MSTPIPRRQFMVQAGMVAGAAYLFPKVAAASATYGANRHYPSNRSPLAATPFVSLPLGSVHARGWLLRQLELQRDGLTGKAEELLPAAKADSAWLGGSGEDWEKGPYYVKGLVPLAYTLDDEGLKSKAHRWIDGIVASQREDGFFGPKKNDDWWPRMVATYLLRDFQEATGDSRIIPLLSAYYRHMEKALPGRHLRDWGRARAGDEMDTIFWLYNRTGEESLLKVADLLREQAYNWPEIYRNNSFLFNGGEMISHNVNVPQALKMPAVWWQRSHRPEDRDSLFAGLRHLAQDHGLPIGINSGTEHLAGRSPSQGVETCSIVEKMLSQETNLRILGEASLGDNLEMLAYNALPGAFSKAIKQHVYYSRPNNVTAVLKSPGFWQDYVDGSVPSPMCGFPCCCYNLHMGWPKFAQNSWAATHDDGLAVLAYAPSEVRAKVGDGTEVTILEETQYPFEESIQFTVHTSKAVDFPLVLRIPGWCEKPVIKVGDRTVPGAEPGQFLRIARKWSDGDKVSVEFPMSVRVVPGINQSVSVERGPLIYTLNLEGKPHITKPRPDHFDQYEILTDSPWNFALALDRSNPANSFAVKRGAAPANPFEPETTPVRLMAKGRRIPSWKLAWNNAVAFDPPYSPVESSEPEEELTLIPYGTRYLRVTSFPVLGKPEVPSRSFSDDFSKGWMAWNAYRGGWYIENGALRCTGGQAGGKVIVAGSNFGDAAVEADVTVGPVGNAGLIVRCANLGTGFDDYTGYYIGIDPGTNSLIAGKANGKWTMLAQVPWKLAAEQTVHLRVVMNGPKFQAFVDDHPQPALEFSDPEFTSGAVGLRQYLPDPKKASVRFANFTAKSI